MSRTAFHPQPWCETCQNPDRSCTGDHSSVAVSVPLTGFGWVDTDYGVELQRIDSFAVWNEDVTDDPIPMVYVSATSPDHAQIVQGRLPLSLAVQLQEALSAAIDHVAHTLGADHHLLCKCGKEQ